MANNSPLSATNLHDFLSNHYAIPIILISCTLTLVDINTSFADNGSVEVSIPADASIKGCETANQCYVPSEITIDVGDEIVWLNDDSASHTVTSGEPNNGPDGNFDSGLFLSGQKFARIFNDAGEYPYFCLVHSWMKGNIIVTTSESKPKTNEKVSKIAESKTQDKIIIKPKISTKPQKPTVGFTELKIDFINTRSGIIQEHIDYTIKITKNGVTIYDVKHLTHSALGTITLPIEFRESGMYSVMIDVSGILFRPVPTQTNALTLDVSALSHPRSEVGIYSDFQTVNCEFSLYTVVNIKTEKTDENTQIRIIDPSGKIVQSVSGKTQSSTDYRSDSKAHWNDMHIPIKIENWNVGQYMIQFQYDGNTYEEKIYFDGNYPSKESLIWCKRGLDAQIGEYAKISLSMKGIENALGAELFAKYKPTLAIAMTNQWDTITIDTKVARKNLEELSKILKEKAQTPLDKAIKKAEEKVRAKYKDNLNEQVEIIYLIRKQGEEQQAGNNRDVDRFIRSIQSRYDAYDKTVKMVEENNKMSAQIQDQKTKAKDAIKKELQQKTIKQLDQEEKIKKTKELAKKKAIEKAKQKALEKAKQKTKSK